jgi:tetraprenyl-beta-curcumene synthase
MALLGANVRYWSSVAPLVRQQLGHWRLRARSISDRSLRTLALAKLDEEGFNAEVAATLATLAPRAHRRRVVKAIVALEILYDYLDGLTESPWQRSPADGEPLFEAFTDAVAPSMQGSGDYYRRHPGCDDGGYLEELAATVRFALAGLPSTARLADVMQRSAARAAAAQLRIHATPPTGADELEQWARSHAAETQLEWREFLAGAASSVLAVHALIAAAADHRTTREQALDIDRTYLSISVLPTVLDSLVDCEQDAGAGRSGYVQLYEGREVLARALARVIDDAVDHARRAPNSSHHVMTLVGAVAYYASAPTARGELARPVMERTGRQLQPLMAPTMAVMRAWRAAKRLRSLMPGKRDAIRQRAG